MRFKKTTILVYLLPVVALFAGCASSPKILPVSHDFGRVISRQRLEDDCSKNNVHGFCGGEEVLYEKCNAKRTFYKNGVMFSQTYLRDGECK